MRRGEGLRSVLRVMSFVNNLKSKFKKIYLDLSDFPV